MACPSWDQPIGGDPASLRLQPRLHPCLRRLLSLLLTLASQQVPHGQMAA